MPYEVLEEGGRYEVLGDAPASVKAGAAVNSIPRQLGLTARYGIEGLGEAAQVVSEPIRAVTDRLFGVTGKTKPAGVLAAQAADYLGLPKPQGADERVVGTATKMLSGAGGLGAAARGASAVPGAVGRAGEFLSANMPAQFASAAGAGAAGQASQEAGGSPVMQGAAALFGGVASGMAPGAAQSAAQAGRRLLTARPSPQQLDAQLNVILERSGYDYSQLPERARQSLRAQAENALRSGQEIDPAALVRLADFARVGATPTRGMVSLDPVQVTREQNLAKIGANTGDSQLQGLARVQNQNNGTLIRNLNDQGAGRGDLFAAGEAAVGGIRQTDDAWGRMVTQGYDRARNMAGGDLPLDRKPFVDNIFGALQRENRMAFLPPELGNTLNAISSGNTPFTPQTVDMLKTMFATASRGATDGNVRAAIGIARNALENTPLNLPSVGPGLVTQQQGQALRGATQQAGNYMGAFDDARREAARRFGWQESARSVDAALGGAQPDKFVRQYVIGGSLNDARAVAQNVEGPAVRDAIVAHLKEKALNGANDEVGKFS
jgi:hypothetical protein